MKFTGIIIFELSLLLVSFIKLLVTNSIISVFVSKKLHYLGKIKILKASFLSITAEIITFLILTAFVSLQLVSSVYSDNIIHKLLMSIEMGVITILGCLDYTKPSSLVYSVLGIVISFIFLFIINYFFIFKKIEVSNGKKFFLSLCCAVINAPYYFLIPFGQLDLFDNIVMNWMY